MRAILVLLPLLFSVAAISQIKTPADIQREKSIKAYNDAYNEANRTNYNKPLGKGGVDQKAVEQLAAKFRYNAGKQSQPLSTSNNSDDEDDEDENPSATKSDYDRTRQIQEQDWRNYQAWEAEQRKMQAEAQRQREREAARTPMFRANYQQLIKYGFQPKDAYLMSDKVTPFTDGTTKVGTEVVDMYKRAAFYRNKYQQEKDTASLGSQLYSIYQFRYLGHTAMLSILELQQKFPEAQVKTDRALLQELPYLYNDYCVFPDNLLKERDTAYRMASDVFMQVFSRMPAEALNSLSAYHSERYDPVQWKFDWCDSKEKDYYAELLLLSNAHIRHKEQAMATKISYDGKNKYFQNKPYSYWQDWAKKLNQTPVDLVCHIIDYKSICVKTMCKENATTQYNYRVDFLNAMLKKLADAGDASALNAWGFRQVIWAENESDRRKGYKLLQKAVDAGSMFARLNLLYLSTKNHPGAPEPEAYQQETIAYLMNASPEVKHNAVIALTATDNPFYEDKGYRLLAYNLCKNAADEGLEIARKALSWKGWEEVKNQ